MELSSSPIPWTIVGNSSLAVCNTTFSRWQRDTLLYANGVTGLSSALCCVVAVSLPIALRLYKHSIYRLSMYQVLGSFLQSFSMGLALMLLNYNGKEMYYRVSCKLTAFLVQYSLLVKLLFTSWLTFHLFFYVVFFRNFQRLEWLYVSTSTLLPLLVVWIPFIHDSYGVSISCHIRSWNDGCASSDYVTGIVEQFVLYYGPAIVSLIVNIIAVVVMVAIMVRRVYASKHGEKEPLIDERNQKVEALKQILPLLSYPIIYFVLLLFPLLDRIYMAASSSRNNYAFAMAHVVIHPIMGLFAGLALILHICILQWRQKKSADTVSRSNCTVSDISPFTSGAATYFSVPIESDFK